MKIKQKAEVEKELDPMDDAYKLLSGEPAIDAVSKAAKGETPETDEEQRMRLGSKKDELMGDIDNAYAQLFESLAIILRRK